MNIYEATLIAKIGSLKNVTSSLQRSRCNTLLKLLGELSNKEKRYEEA